MWLVGLFIPWEDFQAFIMVIDGEISVTAAVSGSKLMQNVGVIEMRIYRAAVGKIMEIDQNEKKKEPPVLQIPEILAKGKVLHQVGWVSSPLPSRLMIQCRLVFVMKLRLNLSWRIGLEYNQSISVYMIPRRCWQSSHFVTDLWVSEINQT